MPHATKTNLKLEILLATMHRDSLDFLSALFPNGNYLDFNILIINQTTENHILKSSHDNIRVINAFERGLAKSRNLAIDNAIGDICLIADDDVRFKKDFEKIILDAHKKHSEGVIITFMLKDFDGNLFKKYSQIVNHNLESIKDVNSVVVSFKRQKLINKDLKFNTNFGLGSIFETADEYIFMRDALKINLKAIFEPKVILSHPFYSSGKNEGSDKLIFARSAVFYKYTGVLAYLKLVKHLYLLIRQGLIKQSQFFTKYKIGLKGILKYKTLVKIEEEH